MEEGWQIFFLGAMNSVSWGGCPSGMHARLSPSLSYSLRLVDALRPPFVCSLRAGSKRQAEADCKTSLSLCFSVMLSSSLLCCMFLY